MYDNKILQGGVHGVLLARWRLRCETPLAIRNGLSISVAEPKRPKTRGMGLTFRWLPHQGDEHEVAALHYGYEVSGSQVRSYHYVPASSVRGALRSWTINHLVQPAWRRDMTPPDKEEGKEAQDAYLGRVRGALSERASGWELIGSLFGSALDTREEENRWSNVGRLRLETERFACATKRCDAPPQPIAANGRVAQGDVGPGNARRQLTVRNPLDRMTHASREGGLHHFLEFCAGEEFVVRLAIVNPQGVDIGLLGLWVREMNDGLLRLGALATIGRGRVKVNEEGYTLWQRPGAPALEGFERFTKAGALAPDDALAGLWEPYTLAPEALAHFQTYLSEHLR